MSEELKPCPFCGGEARLIEPNDLSSPYVMCVANYCTAPRLTQPQAIAAWNRRAEQSDNATLCADVERLREALTDIRRVLLPVHMTLGYEELAGQPVADDSVILSFMGGGASDNVTAGMLRAADQKADAALGASSPATPRGPIDWRDGPPPDELKDGRYVLFRYDNGHVALHRWHEAFDHIGVIVAGWHDSINPACIVAHCPVTP